MRGDTAPSDTNDNNRLSGMELAEKIGTLNVSQAIKAADDGAKVEGKGPGRKREYSIKG